MIGRRRAAAAPPNPFLAPARDEAAAAAFPAAAEDREPIMVDGPPAPTGAPAPAEPLLTVPTHLTSRAELADLDIGRLLIQVCGLHGGAGTSTVTALLGGEAKDCGTGLAQLVDTTLPVLLVARTHALGLSLVRAAAVQWASSGLSDIRLLGVVLVDDAPSLSKPLARQTRSAQRALPHSWRLSWSEDIRHTVGPPAAPVSARHRRIRHSLLRQARSLRSTPPPSVEQQPVDTKGIA